MVTHTMRWYERYPMTVEREQTRIKQTFPTLTLDTATGSEAMVAGVLEVIPKSDSAPFSSYRTTIPAVYLFSGATRRRSRGTLIVMCTPTEWPAFVWHPSIEHIGLRDRILRTPKQACCSVLCSSIVFRCAWALAGYRTEIPWSCGNNRVVSRASLSAWFSKRANRS